jgi:hypothetical protein
MPQFLSGTDCTRSGINIGFQLFPHRNTEVSVQAWKLELLARDQSGVQDHFRAATDALHHCNATGYGRAETASEDAY